MFRTGIAFAALALGAGTAPAAVVTKTVEYEQDGTKLKGFLAYDDAVKDKRPGVLVFPEWWGLNDYAKGRAKQLAELGYVAFAADLYGDGKVIDVAHPEDAGKMATALRMNIKTWRGRAEAALKQLTGQANVDATKVAAIGYCLGGSTALELAYSGADIKAVATLPRWPAGTDPRGSQGDQGEALHCQRGRRQVHRGEGHHRVQGATRRGEGEVHLRELPRGRSQLHRGRCRQGEQPRDEVRQGRRREILEGNADALQGHAREVIPNRVDL